MFLNIFAKCPKRLGVYVNIFKLIRLFIKIKNAVEYFYRYISASNFSTKKQG